MCKTEKWLLSRIYILKKDKNSQNSVRKITNKKGLLNGNSLNKNEIVS